MMFSTYNRILSRGAFPALPIRSWTKPQPPAGLPDDVLDAVGYSDLEKILLDRGAAAIAEFRIYRDKAIGGEANGE
jgi:hypothetical protein